MIRLADNSMIADLRQIRRECFDEDDAYLDFYFSQRFKSEYTLVYLENNRAIASLTMLPCRIATANKTVPASYIYAVATLPAFQRRGISAQLSQHADTILATQNVAAAVLIPASEALFTFYAHQGFSTLFYRRKIAKKINELPVADTQEASSEISSAQLFHLRNTYLQQSECYVQWDETALQYAKNECEFNGGKILFSSKSDVYAFCYPEGKAVIIKESNVEDLHLPTLMNLLRKEFPMATDIIFYCAAHSKLLRDEGTTSAFGMWKYLGESAPKIDAKHPYIGLVLD